MRAEEFFEHFEADGMAGEDEGGPRIMLKLKDFPPNGSFSQHLGRHAQVGKIPGKAGVSVSKGLQN